MRHVVDWDSSAIEWTVSGYELSAPFAPNTSARQTKAIADAVEAAVRHLRRDDLVVTYVEPSDEGQGELLLTSGDLLAIDPGFIRRIVDAAADAAANESAALDARDSGAIEGWLSALRATP
jgi:hypothetical protein